MTLAHWQHVAVTYDGVAIQFYCNGLQVGEVNQSLTLGRIGEPTTIGADMPVGDDGYFDGAIEEVRIYDNALTAEALIKAMRGDARLAYDPFPASGGQSDVELAGLTWKAGDGAFDHDVYLGTDQNAVADADDTDTTGIHIGRQTATTYIQSEPLMAGQTYYWRIDEVGADGRAVTGRVWSFTVGEYLIVDDFETYTGSEGEEVWKAWSDGYGGNGTGSMAGDDSPPYVTTVAFDGLKALPLLYDNTGHFRDSTGNTVSATCSEISREWSSPQDWTRKGVYALSFQFYGCEDNTVNGLDGLYVAVKDIVGKTAAVRYDGIESGLCVAEWQEWSIDLQAFAGVDLANVKNLVLGIGDRGRPKSKPGGKGRMVIDAIRLCAPLDVTADSRMTMPSQP